MLFLEPVISLLITTKSNNEDNETRSLNGHFPTLTGLVRGPTKVAEAL